jgi:homoserine O-acetyltransferase
MKKMPVLMTLCLLIAAVQNVCAQPATDKKQQYASVGDFLMENGQKIIDCKVGYRTLGKLNEKGSNAILYPTPSIDPWQRKNCLTML